MFPEVVRYIRNYIYQKLAYRDNDDNLELSEWGENISWTTLESGKLQASIEKKPLLLIAYFPSCPVCGQLKKSIAHSQEIAEISSYFVMSLINELDIPQTKKYYPDNMGYVPRVMFFDHTGRIMPQYVNQLGNPSKKYFYPNGWSLFRTMKQVMTDYEYDDD